MLKILFTLACTIFSMFAHAAENSGYTYSTNAKFCFQTWWMAEQTNIDSNELRYTTPPRQFVNVYFLEDSQWKSFSIYEIPYGVAPSWDQKQDGVNLITSIKNGIEGFQISAETADGYFKIYRKYNQNEQKYSWDVYTCDPISGSCKLLKTFDDHSFHSVTFFYKQNGDLYLSLQSWGPFWHTSNETSLLTASNISKLKKKKNILSSNDVSEHNPYYYAF